MGQADFPRDAPLQPPPARAGLKERGTTMTVTSVTAVAVALHVEASNSSRTTQTTPPSPVTSPADSVEISQQAVAEARTLTPAPRAEVLLERLDTDGDGVVSKSEFTDGAMALLKRASVQFHHHHVDKGQGVEKRDHKGR